MEIVILAVVIALVAIGAISGLVVSSRKKKLPPPPPSAPTVTAPPAEPRVGEEAERPGGEERRTVEDVGLPGSGATATEEPVVVPPAVPEAPAVEVPEPTAGRLVRLRARLSRSQNSLGKGLLTLLSRARPRPRPRTRLRPHQPHRRPPRHPAARLRHAP
ncbi:hypothetical protein AB0C60_26410, partial [Streptomyces sp. NPDC048845]